MQRLVVRAFGQPRGRVDAAWRVFEPPHGGSARKAASDREGRRILSSVTPVRALSKTWPDLAADWLTKASPSKICE